MRSIEFDPAKDAINRAKHALSLTDAESFDWDAANIVPDKRFEYGEPRFQAYAIFAGRLHVVAYTPREERYRIISFRRANGRETRRYGPEVQS